MSCRDTENISVSLQDMDTVVVRFDWHGGIQDNGQSTNSEGRDIVLYIVL